MMRVCWIGVWGAALGLGAAPVGQDVPAVPPSSVPAGLFDSDTPLQLRLEGDLKALLDDRDSVDAKDHAFTLTYRVGDEAPDTLAIKVKTRGHWRRQKRNCDYPPLWLDFPRSKLEGTVFAGQNKLKLTTPCRPKWKGYEEYILREYLVYKVYNLLTPMSMRVRLATTTYVDATGRLDSLTTHTFLSEHAARMAARLDATRLEVQGARFDDLDSLQLGLAGVFLYMVGGTDWSLSGLHNIELIRRVNPVTYYAVPYDFDWTGIVNARYARPDSRLPILSVRDRLYRGRCLSDAHWEAVFRTFREQKDAIYALYRDMPGLDPKYVKDTHRYLDQFYRTLDDPGRRNRALVRACRANEGI